MKTMLQKIIEPKISYPILIGARCIKKIIPLINQRYARIAVITDSNVARHHLSPILQLLQSYAPEYTILPAGERSKNITSVQRLWHFFLSKKLDRHSAVINLGGGVIGDVGGFAASTFMRGIDFFQIPTTLLAQVDASIGGKTGINFAETKNMVGTFAHPRAVIIDTAMLGTLPSREFNAGYAEILKHGLIADRSYFTKASSKFPSATDTESLARLIADSLRIKSTIVTRDARETGVRKILNFGHTIGHALESASLAGNKPLLHGEAVSIGMAAETHLSYALGLLSSNDTHSIIKAFKAAGLPTRIPAKFSSKKLLEDMRRDKKNKSGALRFTLLSGIGKATFDHDIPEPLIMHTLKKLQRSASLK